VSAAVRVAAVGDIHVGADSEGMVAPGLADLGETADVLLLAGDLTTCGRADEAKVLAGELSNLDVPAFAVLGNHDYHADEEDQVVRHLEKAGVRVLDGDTAVVSVGGTRVGIAGVKGFGGGFAGASGSEFGEREMKAFMEYSRAQATALERGLCALADDGAAVRVALMHYSPVAATLQGEPLEIYPFLGTYLLAEAVDHGGADLVLHGHAHRGSEHGVTPGGVPVRNVAQPVLRAAYRVYCLEAGSG
jgi:Icc-related predicted phosphoesterase